MVTEIHEIENSTNGSELHHEERHSDSHMSELEHYKYWVKEIVRVQVQSVKSEEQLMKVSPNDPKSTLLQALHGTGERISRSAEKIAKGELSVDTLVDLKQDSQAYVAQAKTLGFVSELEGRVLDILA